MNVAGLGYFYTRCVFVLLTLPLSFLLGLLFYKERILFLPLVNFAPYSAMCVLCVCLSFTFQNVQDKAETTWRFYRYGLINEYFERPTLAPPLIIISIVWRFGLYLYHGKNWKVQHDFSMLFLKLLLGYLWLKSSENMKLANFRGCIINISSYFEESIDWQYFITYSYN